VDRVDLREAEPLKRVDDQRISRDDRIDIPRNLREGTQVEMVGVAVRDDEEVGRR